VSFFGKISRIAMIKKQKKQPEKGGQTTINLTMYKAVATSPLHMGAVISLVFADDMVSEQLGGSMVPLLRPEVLLRSAEACAQKNGV